MLAQQGKTIHDATRSRIYRIQKPGITTLCQARALAAYYTAPESLSFIRKVRESGSCGAMGWFRLGRLPRKYAM